MRKALLLVFTLLMLASFSFGIVFAAAQNEFDENGWFQNQNMSALKTNEEGASEFTLGGSVPTYNRTEIDLTKINYLYFRTTSGDWTAFHLIDDTSIVSGNGATWYPSNNTEGKGHVKVSALLNDGAMQLGNGYATPEQGIIGTDKGSPSDVDRYMKFAFYIGTGEGDDVSYLEIDGVKIVGQAGTSLSVKRSDFANGNAMWLCKHSARTKRLQRWESTRILLVYLKSHSSRRAWGQTIRRDLCSTKRLRIYRRKGIRLRRKKQLIT